VGELTQNFDTLITQNEIVITEINKKIVYMPNGFPVDIYLDGMGKDTGNYSKFQ